MNRLYNSKVRICLCYKNQDFLLPPVSVIGKAQVSFNIWERLNQNQTSTTVSDIFLTFLFINQLSQYPQTALMMLVLWVDIFSICVWLTECKGFIEPTACRTVAHNDSCIDSTAITANVQGNRLSSSARLRTAEYDPGEDIVVLQGKGSWLVERMQRQIMKWRRQMRRCL